MHEGPSNHTPELGSEYLSSKDIDLLKEAMVDVGPDGNLVFKNEHGEVAEIVEITG